ncbi:hypothetical protein LEP1GSC016_1094 [Leptospira borgpetersenii serovar Hardjo-bovis str. Sponselee]|uniref:Uncharacterized protein n=2 Tax=Leptospira borgpetersenii TaxID=174 RepID=A0A0E3B9Y6_LEPBO|nr:hypothetical protein LBBP_03311 [Leptospira borgpetersenii serovar Ballum]AMX57427.1 hypothetical protein LBK6_03275 [Leptospira borgpetersenii serovar Hardjo]AWV69324.1 hypothetical protein B9T54_03540 [Leptospira borgpetersenii serovar Hardjo-bovis]EKQ99740.1 hypothetical protein LEP1GSC121_1998 [Leptospira borgpetersenii serovar Castellonis str. 200801910]EMJ83514.1 hypothetical protein LEP1GSC016_1094 [Leptospira borgpetersenii serovar Hardjo-bovis str. Sponselee]EMO09260.1 hypothetical
MKFLRSFCSPKKVRTPCKLRILYITLEFGLRILVDSNFQSGVDFLSDLQFLKTTKIFGKL